MEENNEKEQQNIEIRMEKIYNQLDERNKIFEEYKEDI